MPPSNSLIGEVNATLLALELANHHNLTFSQYEGDSKSVIDNLQSPTPSIPDFLLDAMPIVSSSLKSLFSWEFCFVSRNL